MKLIMKVDEVVPDNFYRCWGHTIKGCHYEVYGEKEHVMNPPDDKGCIYGLRSLGVALSAPATSSSQVLVVQRNSHIIVMEDDERQQY
ncbi:hypothetical protein OROMI_031796 [Orobanche minor]